MRSYIPGVGLAVFALGLFAGCRGDTSLTDYNMNARKYCDDAVTFSVKLLRSSTTTALIREKF